MKEASFYRVTEGMRVQCQLCPRVCKIEPGNSGNCLARRNDNGRLYSLSYGEITSFGVDPVEKKPLYHFYPGQDIVSFGTFGCNLHCLNCQNYRISQFVAPSVTLLPEALLERAGEEPSSIGIAATYNEPTINFEYVLEVFKLNRQAGFKNVLVTNGYLNPEPWSQILDWTDAVNLDIKAYESSFYESVCNASLKPVIHSLDALLERTEVHTELTWLLIEGQNDAPEPLAKFAEHVGSKRPEVPLHISRYYPNYLMTYPETRPQALFDAQKVAGQHLDYVYLGNLSDHDHATYCKACGEMLIQRHGYEIKVLISGPTCPKCGAKHPILMD